MKKILIVSLLSFLSLAFIKASWADNQDVGTVIGGIAGGILGHQVGGSSSAKTAATIGGAVVGSVVGNNVGKSMDDTHRVVSVVSPAHSVSYWHVHRHYSYYNVNRDRTFIGQDGRLCRYFRFVDENGDRIQGTACCYRVSPDSGRCVRWVVVRSYLWM